MRLARGRPLDQFQHQRRDAVALFEAVNLADVGMVQRGECPGLATKARQPLSVMRERLGEDFDRHVAPKFGVTGTIDLAHATRTDLGDNFIRAKTRPGSEPHATDSTRTSWATVGSSPQLLERLASSDDVGMIGTVSPLPDGQGSFGEGARLGQPAGLLQ